jgi:tetratricopeptide (TPR) repeat protein
MEGLAVRSRTSSFAFKGRPRNVREVGDQLGANYILEGSVLRADQQLRVIVQLVRVRDDVPLWSGKFDRRLQDIFSIQDEISRGIVNNLRLRLGRGRRRYETNIEVYELYLRGRALAGQVGRQGGNIRAIKLFEQAVAKDPTFAPAHAALATAHSIRSVVPAGEEEDIWRMRAAAETALQLDPLLAEAHAALGAVHSRDGRWDRSQKSFQRAIELDPHRAATYSECVDWLLMPLGRLDEALAQARIAAKLDPLSPETPGHLAYLLLSLGRYDEAADQVQRMPVSNQNRIQFLARARIGQGRLDEAIRLLSTEDMSPNRGFLGWAYARSGRRHEAEQIAAGTGSERPNVQALVYAGLDDKARAFEALDRMAAHFGPPRVARYLTYPELSVLRDDPRMMVFRHKIGLPQ